MKDETKNTFTKGVNGLKTGLEIGFLGVSIFSVVKQCLTLHQQEKMVKQQIELDKQERLLLEKIDEKTLKKAAELIKQEEGK